MSPMKIPNFLIDRDTLPGYNHIINGNFDIWQRGASQTGNGYGSDDMWKNDSIGTTKIHSYQPFTLSETFPDGTPCPRAFSRTVATSVVGSPNFCIKYQHIENLQNLAGRKYVLSFYAKSNSSNFMAIEIIRQFGSGGTPSTHGYGDIVKKIQLTTTWKRYQIQLDIPSITGKILGTNNNDSLMVVFWFDSGTNFDLRNDLLGHQSGTFDIACVSLMNGSSISPITRRLPKEELLLCQRYYEEFGVNFFRPTLTTNFGGFRVVRKFVVEKRTVPVIGLYMDANKTNSTQINTNKGVVSVSALSTPGADRRSVYFHNSNTILTAEADYGQVHVTADASI
jgi:hypothetical protein